MIGIDGSKCPHSEADRTNWGAGNHGCGRCGSTPNDLGLDQWKEARLTEEAEQNWITETTRSGITMDTFSDDRGVLGVPGTWHRVQRGSDLLLTTRNRGDALRLFQRQVRLASGA